MDRSSDTLVLKGNAVVHIQNPNLPGPTTATADVVTVWLNENRMNLEDSGDKQSEVVIPEKEK
jgi:lipopolysaccharide export system protein LptA